MIYVCTYLANQCSLSPVGICMIRAISDNVITAVGPVKWILMFSVCLYVCVRMWYNDSVGSNPNYEACHIPHLSREN